MNHYILVKGKRKLKLVEKMTNAKGVTFKNQITIYNNDIIKYVVNKKINIHFNQLVMLYKLYLATESEEDSDALNKKINTLSKLIFSTYNPYISEEKINKYKLTIKKIKNNIKNKKKNRQI